MKKLLKISLIFFAIIFGVRTVRAEESCDNFVLYAKNKNDFVNYGDVYMNYSNVSYHYEGFTFRDKNNKAYTGYCRNAGWTAGKVRDNQVYRCSDVVFDTTDKDASVKKQMYDAGIISILSNGYSTVNGSVNYNDYVATTIALRVYEMLWPEFDTNGRNKEAINYAHQYYVNKWNDDETVKKLLLNTVGEVKKDYSTAKEVTSLTTQDNKKGNNITETIENKAKNLVIKGLTAAENYKKKGAASIKYTESMSKSPVQEENGIETYKMALAYNFNISNFTPKDGAYVKFNFTCENCKSLGIDYVITANGKEVKNGDDLLSLLSNGNGTVTFVIQFIGTSNNYGCEGIKYKLDVDYYDGSISTKAYNMYSAACSNNINCQHFYLLYSDDSPKTISVEDTVELCTLDCETIEKNCKNGDKAACATLKSEFGGSCSGCSTKIVNDVCKDDEITSTLEIKEGYKSKDVCDKNDDPDILSCVINKKDTAGNTYQEKDFSTKYCTVWCKEDYHFTMPGNKELNSGRYFSLASTIKGTKTCYTSKIDTEQFEKDYEAARQKVINAYNEFALHTAASQAKESEKTEKTIKINYPSGHYTCTQSVANCNANKTTCEKECRNKYSNAHGMVRDAYYQCLKDCGNCEKKYKIDGVDCVKRQWVSTSTSKTITLKSYTNEFAWSGYTTAGGVSTYFVDRGENYELYCSGGTCKYKSEASISCTGCTKLANGNYSCSQNGSCTVTDGVDLKTIYNSKTASSKQGILKNAIGISETVAGDYTEDGKPLKNPSTTGVPSTSLTGILLNYNYCSSWNMDYNFDPEMYFWYEDSYMNSVSTDKMETVGTVSVDSKPKDLSCEGDVDNAYEKCDTGWKSGFASEKVDKFLCYKDKKSALGYTCGWKKISIATSSRMKSTMKAQASYITPTQFHTIYPSGSVVVAEPGTKIDNASELTNGLPVALSTKAGVYNYTLVVENLGEYFNSDKLGRVWGDHNSVLSSALKENDNCIKNPALTDSITIDGKYFDEGVYTCAYKINCPDCPVVCDPDCKNPNCPDNNCPTVCSPSCVFNNGDININYRPITPDEINPNDRELGDNWNVNGTVDTSLEMKAAITTNEIEEKGEYIYDINYNSSEKEFSMEVVMDSKMISWIRNYNNSKEDEGGYLNNTLSCYDHKNNLDGQTYKNIYCYSSFIDEMLNEKDLAKNIKFSVSRPLSVNDRKNYDNSNKFEGYWTTWSLATLNNSWNINTTITLESTQKNYKTGGIGPAWK